MAYGIKIDDVFTTHDLSDAAADTCDSIREQARRFAHWIDENVPPSPEQTLALRKLQECMMFANSAVAIHGVPE